jgi:hypothetical protein
LRSTRLKRARIHIIVCGSLTDVRRPSRTDCDGLSSSSASLETRLGGDLGAQLELEAGRSNRTGSVITKLDTGQHHGQPGVPALPLPSARSAGHACQDRGTGGPSMWPWRWHYVLRSRGSCRRRERSSIVGRLAPWPCVRWGGSDERNCARTLYGSLKVGISRNQVR